MDVNKLRELVQMLKSEGVEYYEGDGLTLYIRPALSMSSIPSFEKEPSEPTNPLFDRLPANYKKLEAQRNKRNV